MLSELLVSALCTELTCSLCGGVLQKPVTLRRCGCSFCRKCVEATLEGKGIILSQCPACATPVEHRELLDNRLLESLVSICGRSRLRLNQLENASAAHAAEQSYGNVSCVTALGLQHTATLRGPPSAQHESAHQTTQQPVSATPATSTAQTLCAALSALKAEDEAAAPAGPDPVKQHSPHGPTAAAASTSQSSEQSRRHEVAGEEACLSQPAEKGQMLDRTAFRNIASPPAAVLRKAAAYAEDAEAPRPGDQQQQQAGDASPAVATCIPAISRWPAAEDQEDTAELPDEEIQARIVQLREKLARMEQCIADIDIAIHQKELEEARAGAGHDEAGAPSQQTQPQTDGSAAVVLCSETPSTGTPSLPALRCTDPSRRTSGPLSAHTNMRSQRAFRTIAYYGADKAKLDNLGALCKRWHYTLSPDGHVDRFTTDLLVPASNGRTQVTFEYLLALICGIRVLAWDWVYANHSSPSVADEAFEIKGDNFTSLVETSKRGRMRRKQARDPLFDKLLVVLPPSLRGGGCCGVTRDELAWLVREAGGLAAETVEEAVPVLRTGMSVYLVTEEQTDAEQLAMAWRRVHAMPATNLRPEWLIACLSRLMLSNTASYEHRLGHLSLR